MAEFYIESVTISPNPVQTGARLKIEVEVYTVFPALDIYPAINLCPGVDLFTLYPGTDVCPDTNIYPSKGEFE